MKQDLATGDIRAKFQMLISMDESVKQRLEKEKSIAHQNDYIYNKLKEKPNLRIQTQGQKDDKDNDHMQNRFKEVIFTKGDIVKEISKLKPYLNPDKQELTTVEIQNLQNKKMSSEQKKNLSNVIIYLNKRLCQKLRQQASIQQQLGEDRVRLQKQGWIYEVFYRRSQNNKAQLSNTQFKAGYAILTTVLELFENLTFTRKLVKLNVSEIRRVKYTSQKEYEIIDIRYDGGTLQIAFLNQQKLQLFDRMLFLLKNMARTSNNRLFQNQLIKSLYADY